jgi:UDP-N-acetyl-D-glucosamine dehydrogenase
MPRYVVQRVQDALNEQGKSIKNAKVLVLGVAYKANVSDTRESPALDVIGLLKEKNASVAYYDPHIPSIEHEGWDLDSVSDVIAESKKSDCVIIITDHSAVEYAAIAGAAPLIFDTRNVMGGQEIFSPNILRM